ncbi:MAG: FkbM family methyltransferase, partial [Bradyrhizobium icense]
ATIFVVTIHNPHASYATIRRRLQQQTAERVISFLDLAWALPEIFLPYLAFELPQAVLAKAAPIRRTFGLLADAESQRQFVAHLTFRLWLDFDALPASCKGDYLDDSVLGPLAADITYVDCSAFDGDTIRPFLARTAGRFARILAYEPDAENYRKLTDYVGALPEAVRRRIVTRQAGVWDKRQQLVFMATGTTGAAFGDGAGQADAVALDDEIADDDTPLLIKIDVEGAEAAALAGARRTIQRRRPSVVLSIYHRPDDLWELPAALHALDPSSRLFIRTLGEDGMDVVCYLVPRDVAR